MNDKISKTLSFIDDNGIISLDFSMTSLTSLKVIHSLEK